MPVLKRILGGWTAFTGLIAILLLPAVAFVQPALAQANGGGSEPSQQDILTHYSLYWENFKNEDYASALPDLRWILDHAPTAPNDDDRNLERAVQLYSALAQQAENEATKQAYLDTAYTILNEAPAQLESLGADYSEYSWTLDKGRFLQQYADQMPDVSEKAVTYYRKAFKLAPQEMDPYYIDRIITQYVEANQQQEALAFMDQVEAKRADDQEAMQVVNQYRKRIFGRNPQARIAFLEQKLEENPDDPQTMADLFELYLNQRQRDKAAQLSQKLLQANPPLEVYRQIAQMRLEDGKARRAFELYQKAEHDAEEPLTAQDYYRMGDAQEQMGNLPEARSYYRRALEQNPNYGQAYIAIGDLYTQAVSECGGSPMNRGDKAVYWLAVDMYQRAKSVDASVASTANSKIQTYRKYFPTAEDIFYRDDMEVGESFRVDYGCYAWINETTTVRQATA